MTEVGQEFLQMFQRLEATVSPAAISYGAVLDGELVFVPGEVPRRGVFGARLMGQNCG